MAMNIVQVGELERLLLEVPGLVDLLERRQAQFSHSVLEWLKRVEKVLESHHQAKVSEISMCRASIVQASRGEISKEIAFTGRPTPRKLKDAVGKQALHTAESVLNTLTQERKDTFTEAERLASQLIAIADAKGLLANLPDKLDNTALLNIISQRIAGDSDLAGGLAQLKGLVGRYDYLVFLDRARPLPQQA